MDDELDRALGQLAARARLKDGQALAQANFFLLRALLQYLVIEGPMEVDRLRAVLGIAHESADKSEYPEAATILKELSDDLLRSKRDA
jgi:hypothetical protein